MAVTAAVILKAAKLATDRATDLHTILRNALIQLESDVITERTIRLEKIRLQREKMFDFNRQNIENNEMNISTSTDHVDVDVGVGGIARDDPMLAWASLHQAAGLRETE